MWKLIVCEIISEDIIYVREEIIVYHVLGCAFDDEIIVNVTIDLCSKSKTYPGAN